MAFTLIPRPPRVTGSGDRDRFELTKWYDALWKALGKVGGVAWGSIDFNGSSLSDLESRPHVDLQAVQQADVDSISAALEKHITDLLAYGWKRNLSLYRSVAVNTTIVIGEHLTVDCTAGDITVTLPDATTNGGYPVWIHKSDSSANKVLTSVRDIAFQNSTMHLISNGTDWVIS